MKLVSERSVKVLFSYTVIKRWNQLDQLTVDPLSINVFKSRLDKLRKRMLGSVNRVPACPAGVKAGIKAGCSCALDGR